MTSIFEMPAMQIINVVDAGHKRRRVVQRREVGQRNRKKALRRRKRRRKRRRRRRRRRKKRKRRKPRRTRKRREMMQRREKMRSNVQILKILNESTRLAYWSELILSGPFCLVLRPMYMVNFV